MKSKAERTAEELVCYFNTARQVGHTTRMLEGVDANSIVVAHDTRFADTLSRKTDAICISLSSIPNGKLRGYSHPLVLDNAATLVLLNDLLVEMKNLREENAKHRMTIEMVKKILE